MRAACRPRASARMAARQARARTPSSGCSPFDQPHLSYLRHVLVAAATETNENRIARLPSRRVVGDPDNRVRGLERRNDSLEAARSEERRVGKECRYRWSPG